MTTTDQLRSYPVGRERDPFQVPALVAELGRFGVDLPPEISQGAGHLSDLSGLVERAIARPFPSDLVGMDEETLMAVIRQHAASAAVSKEIRRGMFQDLRTGLAGQVADALAAIADDVVDQLREAGRAPAEAVHRATRLGITPHTSEAALLKSDKVAELASVWTGLEGHAAQLEQLAGLRFRLSTTTGVPPIRGWDQTGSAGQVEYEHTAKVSAFGLGGKWQADRQELPWQRWIRLSAAGPALLVSIEDAHAAMRARGAVLASSTLRRVPVLDEPRPRTESVEVIR